MQAFAVAVATLGGVGRAPIAPGTVGSLCAVPLVRWIAGLRVESPALAAGCVAGVVALAIWAAGRAAPVLGAHDHSAIVIDEVAGMAIAALLVPATWWAVALALGWFRLFDVWKPAPAGWIDRDVRGGFGVVGDDLVAGLYAGGATLVTMRIL